MPQVFDDSPRGRPELSDVANAVAESVVRQAGKYPKICVIVWGAAWQCACSELM